MNVCLIKKGESVHTFFRISHLWRSNERVFCAEKSYVTAVSENISLMRDVTNNNGINHGFSRDDDESVLVH
eukprot:m.485758 g.485758  ORF g.485758 m.485758 type:complete len:71 (+) comp21738_c0_seq3:2886-3098(+)